MIFQGSGECADVVWQMFGLSMPTCPEDAFPQWFRVGWLDAKDDVHFVPVTSRPDLWFDSGEDFGSMSLAAIEAAGP